MDRRRFLGALGGVALSAAAAPLRPADAPPANDFCGGPPGRPLAPAGERGWLARISPRGGAIALRAAEAPAGSPWPLAFATPRGELDPTLVVERGERVRLALSNALPDPTIVHFHGLANDTRNDGAVVTPIAQGERYEYDFTVRDRAGLYWYHPHPHGRTAGQVYRGLFGLVEVADDDERALRRALDLTPGTTERTLVLQDRRAGDGAGSYAPGADDVHHGFLGDVATVNGAADPVLDVASRLYRFRILNASNARTYRLAFRDAAGRALPFALIGTDGGLLDAPVRCDACFVSPAERIDVLVDLSAMPIGEAIVLFSGPFDAMHSKTPSSPTDASAAPGADAAHGAPLPAASHAVRWPEGEPRGLMTLRVRERVRATRAIPARLSSLPAVRIDGARERPLRLGFNKARWRINDRVYVPGEDPIEVARDTTEVWLLRNYYTSMPHAMHLHGFPFRVLERETSPDALAPLATHGAGRLATDLGLKDTVLVWPGESVRIAIDFRLAFDGRQHYLFHCHNLEHEDGGMMLGVAVG